MKRFRQPKMADGKARGKTKSRALITTKQDGKLDLIDKDDAVNGGNLRLTVNKEYAARHTHNKQREELDRLKELHGGAIPDDEDESTSESEDSDAEALTAEVEQDFFVTLAKIKDNRPEVYDKTTQFFRNPTGNKGDDDGKDSATGSAKAATAKTKAKPVYLRDHERMRLQTKGDQAFVSDDDDDDSAARALNDVPENKRTSVMAFDDEQRSLRKNLLKALHGDGAVGGAGQEDAGEGSLFELRERSSEELAREEDDYASWLAGETALANEQAKEDLEPLRRYWTSKDLDDKDKFLRDFITKKKWRQEEDVLPTYDQITTGRPATDGAGSTGAGEVTGAIDLLEDQEHVEKQEAYEHKYNFRFEEPDAAEIKSFPRSMDESVRQKNTKRQNARERAKERREEQKQRKHEEIQRLKKLKQTEIAEKLAQIKEISGNGDLAVADSIDLDGEFDPEAHDKQMEALFGDEYYEGEDDSKPVFADDDDGWEDGEYNDDDNHDDEQGDAQGWGGEGTWEDQQWTEDGDPDIDMDADFDPSQQDEGKKTKKMSRAQLKRLEAAIERGEHDAELAADPTLKKYMDEYYSLDYEDIVGGIPTRFKYREVVANDYGLSAEEVLAADDKELNQWASLKRLVQYREETLEKRDLRVYKKRTKNMKAKQDAFGSSEAWKKAAVADDWEQKRADRQKAKELERKAAVIEMRKRKKEEKLTKGKGKKEGGVAATAAEPTSDAGGVPEDKPKNHRERRREARLLAKKDGRKKSGSSKEKKVRKKAKSATALKKEKEAEVEARRAEKLAKKKSKNSAKKPGSFSDARLAAYGLAPAPEPASKGAKKKRKSSGKDKKAKKLKNELAGF